MIELNPERHDELAALIASHMEEGGETLRSGALVGARRLLGRAQPAASDALRLWQRGDGADRRARGERGDRRRWRCSRGCCSSTTPGGWAWTRGGERAGRRGGGDRDRTGDLRSLALLQAADLGPAGPRPPTPANGSRRSRRRSRSPTSPATCTCGSRSAAPAAYAYLCAGDFDGSSGSPTRCSSSPAATPALGAGIVIGSPLAWALMAQGAWCAASATQLEEAEALLERALRIADEQGDPETASWSRSNQALLLAMRGDARGGAGAGSAQLRADRAARRRLLAQPGAGQPRPTCSSPPATTRRRWSRRGGRAALPRGDGRRRRDGGLARRRCGPRR